MRSYDIIALYYIFTLDVGSSIQNDFSRLLTDKQVSDIILSLLHKKDYRQAAQVIESLNFRINDGNPDLFLSLWNDQRFGFDGKVFFPL